MTISKRGHFGVLLLSCSLSLQYFVACSSGDTEASNDAGGTAGSGGSGGTNPTTGSGGTNPTTGSGGTSPGTTGGPVSEDLFACNLDLSCTPACSHLGTLGDCGGDGACVESVWAGGEPGGKVMFLSRPGPGGYQSDALFVLLGDGQVLRQERSRSCPNGEIDCDLEAMPWSVAEQQRCDMGTSYTLEVEDCVNVDHSCDEVKDGLVGAAGSAGEGGEAGHAGEAAE